MNNLVGQFEYVDASEVVAGMKMYLGIKDTSEHDAYLTDCLNRGVKRIKNRGTQIQTVAKLPIVNFRAKLPMNFIKFAHQFPIVYCDAFGNTPLDSWNVPIYINNAFVVDSPFQLPSLIRNGTVNMVNGWLEFSTDITARFCKVALLTANVDINGNLAVLALAEDALICFGCWQFGLTFGGFDQYRLETWRQQWRNGKKELTGFYNGDQGFDRPLITYIMNVMV